MSEVSADWHLLEVLIEAGCEVEHESLSVEVCLCAALSERSCDLAGSFDSLELNVGLRFAKGGSEKLGSTCLSLSLNDS